MRSSNLYLSIMSIGFFYWEEGPRGEGRNLGKRREGCSKKKGRGKSKNSILCRRKVEGT